MTVAAVNDNNPVVGERRHRQRAGEQRRGPSHPPLTATDADLPAAAPDLLADTAAPTPPCSPSTPPPRVTFNTAPDYENPADTGNDNTYNVIVTASDGT